MSEASPAVSPRLRFYPSLTEQKAKNTLFIMGIWPINGLFWRFIVENGEEVLKIGIG
ncbi:hypothetical protein [Klebsiella oxytoca]|uniref:hypothetical protein n=1 Tax=Klebsiella oxytoca TaxID=571 RepID=UPI00157B2990|nr:hypothetical protein [Klebsiella oxytoca]